MKSLILSKLVTGMPPPSAMPAAFPGLQLTKGDLAAMRSQRWIAGLVRAGQLACLAYGVVYTVRHGGASGLVVGILLAWLIGLAMPMLPASVSAKITAYLAAESGPQ